MFPELVGAENSSRHPEQAFRAGDWMRRDALGPFRARSSRGEPAVVKAANFAKRFDP